MCGKTVRARVEWGVVPGEEWGSKEGSQASSLPAVAGKPLAPLCVAYFWEQRDALPRESGKRGELVERLGEPSHSRRALVARLGQSLAVHAGHVKVRPQ